VRNLFFNLPARRKFLRSEATERAHIQHYLSLAALAFPEVAFTFLDEQRITWQLPQVRREGVSELAAVQERLRGLYGSDLDLLALDFSKTIEGAAEGQEDSPTVAQTLRVWGFIGAPGVSRGTRDEQHLFVNRRPVENRGLNFALLEGYHTALMKGRYPVCCLFLEMDPGAVDVNIHPTKREVKFHQENLVRHVVTQAVRETLLRFHAPRPGSESVATVTPPAIPKPSTAAVGSPAAAATAPVPEEIVQASTLELPTFIVPPQRLANTPAPPQPASTGAEEVAQPAPVRSDPAAPAAAVRPAAALASAEPVPLLHVPLRLLGVLGRLYVVLESDRGMVLLDQHAAHERILFEQMLRRLEQGNAPSQRLLLPKTVELSARDAQFVREQLPSLARMGVSLSEFGERTFLLDGLPAFVKVSDARGFVLELVDGLKAAGESVNSWRLGEHTVAKTVCRHAVKANDPLAESELEKLVNDLRQCTMPYTCPHGRPTLIEMSFRELEKKFGRIQ
jgi:DNA mismatch repair protein MutL